MKILIIKTGALGDVVRCSFIAQALKDKYKRFNPKILWVTDEKAFPLFLNNPYVNKVIKKEDKENYAHISFDLAVNLEEDEDNCKFVSSIRPRRIVGFFYKEGKVMPTPSAEEWFNMSALGKKPENDILKKKNKKTHRQIMGEIIGVDANKYTPFLRLTSNQRKFSTSFLRRHNLKRGDTIIGINTGSADRWPKQLSIKKTALLIDNLSKKFNAKILLFGGPNEITRNREVMAISRSHIIDTGCGNDLKEFPALISVCDLFITADTLGLHIALALKRKTIVLIGPTSHSEIDMYSLGEKVIAKSDCVCCYKGNCKSMDKIDLKEILYAVKKLINQKLTLVITAYKEPNIEKTIQAAINQKTSVDYEVVLSSPDENMLLLAKKYPKLKIIKDLGKGKSKALNLIFSKLDTDILILTDGDVILSENSVQEIYDLFLDPEIGCVSGQPVPMEDRKTKYGYWANFLFESAHQIRKNAFEKNSFIECSGYLFAFRKNFIKSIPLDIAEDAYIPYYFWEQGFKIGYAEKAKVFVKNPNNWADWIKQKTRTSKAHEKLDKYVDTLTTPKVKSFKTEASGIFRLFSYPKNFKEFIWTSELAFARGYMWLKVFYDTQVKNRQYGDAWERVESTK